MPVPVPEANKEVPVPGDVPVAGAAELAEPVPAAAC